jgi:hypothetical protein
MKQQKLKKKMLGTGERYKLLRDNTTFISARYIQGRFARFLHLAGCDVAQDWSLLVSGT